MHLFGLTGGIASGKSTVAARFAARGLPVLDADVFAREVVARGSEGLAAVTEAFGPTILDAGGELDRKALAALVFGNDERRRTLNGLLHPRIARRTFERAQELTAQGEPLACYEAALLVENGLADAFRPLVVVATAEALQTARARSRDGVTEDEARARIRAQMPLDDKVAKADFVIRNDGTLAELTAEADRVLAAVCEKAGVGVARYPVPAGA